MALSNYSGLQAVIADTLNRTDLTSQIPDFVALAEAEFRRLPWMQSETVGTLTLDANYVALPTDCSVVLSLYYNEDAARGPIEIVSPERLAALIGGMDTTGRPWYAAVEANGTYLRLGPAPDATYTARLTYRADLSPLATASTNWLLTDFPDVYLYGSLVHSAPFLKDDARVVLWQALLDRAIEQARVFLEHRRYPTQLVARPTTVIG